MAGDGGDERGRLQCSKCGSTEMIPNADILDQGQGSDRSLQVVVYGNPDALILKDRLYGVLMADICGDCGHADLKVANPEELYEHYLRSLD
jgi:ribosomal protein S27AE